MYDEVTDPAADDICIFFFFFFFFFYQLGKRMGMSQITLNLVPVLFFFFFFF